MMKGRVLDVGGKKTNSRGTFTPPLDIVKSWKYLNTDDKTEPDYCCNAEAIPLDDASIDTIIMTEVLEYFPKPRKVFSEIYRILNVNGYVLVSIPFLNPIHGDHWADRSRFTPVMLKQLVTEAGFKLQTLEPMGSVGAVLFDILRVTFGYASKKGEKLFLSKILGLFRPLFKWIDSVTIVQKEFINTGYFLVMSKQV